MESHRASTRFPGLEESENSQTKRTGSKKRDCAAAAPKEGPPGDAGLLSPCDLPDAGTGSAVSEKTVHLKRKKRCNLSCSGPKIRCGAGKSNFFLGNAMLGYAFSAESDTSRLVPHAPGLAAVRQAERPNKQSKAKRTVPHEAKNQGFERERAELQEKNRARPGR
jgi:hypothetical protein